MQHTIIIVGVQRYRIERLSTPCCGGLLTLFKGILRPHCARWRVVPATCVVLAVGTGDQDYSLIYWFVWSW